jgi:hypothetical protein
MDKIEYEFTATAMSIKINNFLAQFINKYTFEVS